MSVANAHKLRISVVVPTHDTLRLTLACMESLAAVDLAGVEVILVDDASGDGTAEAIRQRHPETRIFRSDQPQGFSVSANRGLAAARGELLLLLNSDTEVKVGAWDALEEAFRQNARLGVVGAALCYPNGALQWSGGRFPSLPWLFFLASGLPPLLRRVPGVRTLRPVSATRGGPVDWVTGAAMAIRRQVWTEVGPFDESYRFYGQDLDFCTRARQSGWGTAVARDFRVLHHQGATIGRERGAVGRHSPELLWRDLVRWGWKHRGSPWARWAAAALRGGGRVRLIGRALRGLFLASEARAAWRQDSLAYRQAMTSVRQEIRALHGLSGRVRRVDPDPGPQSP